VTGATPSPTAPRSSWQQRIAVIGVAGVALVLLIAGIAILAPPAALDRAAPAAAAMGSDGIQVITVEIANGVYRPNILRAKAGAPLRIRVVVGDRHSCATKLLVPDLKLDFDLPAAGSSDLTIPAAPRGSYLFTCGQKMVKGTLVVE
jgi:plastocyanin domain-containing protein